MRSCIKICVFFLFCFLSEGTIYKLPWISSIRELILQISCSSVSAKKSYKHDRKSQKIKEIIKINLSNFFSFVKL